MSWKREYILWYKFIEEILGDAVPHHKDEEIVRYVSAADWLVVPLRDERDREEAKNRPAPNLFMSLHEDSIHIGISYQNLPSIELFKNISHEFHDPDRSEFLNFLKGLNEKFKTSVYKIIKYTHFSQVPDYEKVFEFTTNMIDENKLDKVISISDSIREEGRELRKLGNLSWAPIIPGINLLDIHIDVDDNKFKEILEQIKPIYNIILKIKTKGEIVDEIKRQKRTLRLSARDFYYCPGCSNEYSLEDYKNYRFCKVCETSRAAWIRGDELI